MRKIKTFGLLIIFVLFSACGYKSIYTEDRGSFKINEIKFEGDQALNNITNKRFQKYFLPINLQSDLEIKEFSLNINSSSTRNILTRSSTGKVGMFELIITLDVKTFSDGELLLEKSFSAKNVYNNESNKFALSQYEKVIKKELLNKLIDEIINYINNIK